MKKGKDITISAHDAKIIAAMLRGYCNLLSEITISEKQARTLIVEEKSQALYFRHRLMEKVAV